MVIIETRKIPFCVPNQAAPPEGHVHFMVAQIGSKNCTARMFP
jgi:hypothetical protein